MTPDVQPVIAAQRRISVIINTILSAAFFGLVFGLSPRPLTFGPPDQLSFDFVPQSLAIGFFSALVPTLIVAAMRRKGDIEALGPQNISGRVMFVRAVVFALAAAVVGGLIAIALATVDGEIDYFPALIIKMLYGALLGWLITPRAVSIALQKD
jgi:hypothetical protein